MDAKELFEIWKTGLKKAGCLYDFQWDDLEDADVSAWEHLSKVLDQQDELNNVGAQIDADADLYD